MDIAEFRKYGHQLVDWIADYYQNVEQYPVKSQVVPGEIFDQLPNEAPKVGESMDDILLDFNQLIMPGITHWQHPNFHAYFPANGSFPSLLAEMLTAALGAQCMIWETSPAAAELEEKVLNWLRDLSGLPKNWHGVIQDTASTATLAAILSAREKASNFNTNRNGINGQRFKVYCSEETHSSIEKAVKIAGIGSNNLVKIPCDNQAAMLPELLENAIESDIANGDQPLIVIAAVGTTGTLGVDPISAIGKLTEKHGVWLHIDAAYAGTAMLLPEYQYMIDGVEMADSYVFNPHKWMFTHFDCTAYFVRDRDALVNTFEILPEYLKTKTEGKVNNYRDWGIPLGRRFRALKLWFVIRHFGVEGIQKTLRGHMLLTNELSERLVSHQNFELITPTVLNTICFRYINDSYSEKDLNKINQEILQRLNDTGGAYLTHTKFSGKYTMRIVIGQTNVNKGHIDKLWDLIQESVKVFNP